jgi:hypothetical protein
MKEKPTDHVIMDPEIDAMHDEEEMFPPEGDIGQQTAGGKWFSSINAKDVINNLPVMTYSKGQTVRIQIPVHESTEIIATKIREKYPEKFRINLDVHKSMLYAGRQLFDHVFLQNADDAKKSKNYRMAKLLDSVQAITFDAGCLEKFLEKLLEGYVKTGQGAFSRDKILAKIDEMKALLSEDLKARCDNFIDEELDSEAVMLKMKERLRKRVYRERRKNIHLVDD